MQGFKRKNAPASAANPVADLPEVFNNSQFTGPADRLLEAIRQHFSKVEGRNVERSESLEIANKVLEKRL